MNRRNHWRAKMMARMARDGDVESLAEMISEVIEALLADPGPTAPERDPMAAAVAQAVAEASGAPADAPVVVETPVDQPVLIDCGPAILEALNRIISLLTAGATADCNGSARQQDEDPDAPENADTPAAQTAPDPAASAATAAAEVGEAAAEAAGSAAEAIEATAEAVIWAAAEAMGVDPAASADEDPVEALVAEILEGEAGEPLLAAENPAADPALALQAIQSEILSGILEPDDPAAQSDEDPDQDEAGNVENAAHAADALRTALAAFRPQLRKMSPGTASVSMRHMPCRVILCGASF